MPVKKSKPFVGIKFKDLDASSFAHLVESEQRYRRMLALTNDPIIEFSFDGKVVFATQAIRTLFGYDPEKLVGQPMMDFVHIADRARVQADFEALLKREKAAVRTVFRGLHANGAYSWVETVGQLYSDDRGQSKTVFASVRDISAQYEAMAALKKSNFELMLFKLAAQKSFNHIIITDPDGKIVFANDSVTRMTGYAITEVIGQTPAVWGKQMPQDFYVKFWDTIKVKRQPFHDEVINRRKDGSLYRAIMTVSPIINDAGTLIGFIGVEEDVSALKPPTR